MAASSPFALVHSPLAGPSSWRGVAAALAQAGRTAVAVDYGRLAGPNGFAEAGERIAARLGKNLAPAILVVHSAAGALVPTIVEAAPGRVAAIVFVDALLPHPGQSWMETAPRSLATHLTRLAAGGVLPPWNRWFADDPTAGLIPDAQLRRSFVSDLPRVPMAYLEAVAPLARKWAALPATYLQLSDAYDREAAQATRRGWRVRCAPMHHLAMVTDPARLAKLLAEVGDL